MNYTQQDAFHKVYKIINDNGLYTKRLWITDLIRSKKDERSKQTVKDTSHQEIRQFV
jgi:hypothetical protein